MTAAAPITPEQATLAVRRLGHMIVGIRALIVDNDDGVLTHAGHGQVGLDLQAENCADTADSLRGLIGEAPRWARDPQHQRRLLAEMVLAAIAEEAAA